MQLTKFDLPRYELRRAAFLESNNNDIAILTLASAWCKEASEIESDYSVTSNKITMRITFKSNPVKNFQLHEFLNRMGCMMESVSVDSIRVDVYEFFNKVY